MPSTGWTSYWTISQCVTIGLLENAINRLAPFNNRTGQSYDERSNSPHMGQVLVSKQVKCPTFSPIQPGRGVVGHNIDRCIMLWQACHTIAVTRGLRIKYKHFLTVISLFTDRRSTLRHIASCEMFIQKLSGDLSENYNS